jgi:hypothetical protein
MKESNFYSDEFEQLIREKTEQYKMYPSEKVWKGIHGSLHTKRKWFIGSMAILVTGILFFAGKELITPTIHLTLAKKMTVPAGLTEGNAPKTAHAGNAVHTSFSTIRENTSSSATVRHGSEVSDDPSAGDKPYKEITITISNPVISQPDLSLFLSRAVKLPAEVPSLPVIAGHGPIQEGLAGRSQEEGTAPVERGAAAIEIPAENGAGRSAADVKNSRVGRNGLASTRSGQEPIIRKEMIPDSAGEATKTSATTIAEAIDRQRVNWLQDYAVYTLSASPKRARTYLQLSFSPTVNYRSLSGGYLTPPKTIDAGSSGNFIDHTPAVGFQLGGSLLYRVTRNLTVKGGLQFNFSRYKINAHSSDPQQPLVTRYGYYMDSVNSRLNNRPFTGSPQLTLNNDYYQLSAPIGLELRVLGNERLQFNIGATIQPTYLLNVNPYMLTSNYYNYIKEPSQFRRWNLNGGLEAFLSYKTNSGIRWQIGPEFRYQLLSTYSGQYPIHENLKGYGLKIGITKLFP